MIENPKYVCTLLVRVEYPSHCKNCFTYHCVAIVAHWWSLRIRDTFGGSPNGWNVQMGKRLPIGPYNDEVNIIR